MNEVRIADPGRSGAVSWVDLSTPDVGAATTFYTGLLEWSIETSTAPEYRIATIGDRQVCGLMGQPDGLAGSPAVWTVFFTIDDLDGTLATVSERGGHVLQPPIDIPGGARVAVAADPAGAMFALICGGPRPAGRYLSREPGSVGWVETLTRDPLAAVTFYEVVFGWHTHSDETTGYTTFTLDGADVCGMLPMPADVPPAAPSHWATYFAVADCDEIAERCVELGGQILRAPTRVGEVRFAVLEDPQGATFSIIESS